MESPLDFVPTKFSALNEDLKKEFEAVTYKSYNKKDKKKSNANKELVGSNNSPAFDVKKARHEILKFGMSGFDPKKKQEAKIQLAIKLGAKPPKKVYKNYKELLEEKKNQTLEQKQNLQFQQLGKNEFGESLGKTRGKSKRFNRKRKFIKGSLLEAYGNVKVNKNK